MLFIQVTGQAEGRVMAALAEAKYARESVLTADRGTIVDRNGELIASDTLSYRLVAVLSESASKGAKKPHHVQDFEKTAEVLSNYIPMEKEEILSRLKSFKEADRWQVEFGKAGRDINHESALKLRDEKLPGILLIEDKKRFYPNGIFASYLVGFTTREEQKDGIVSTVGRMGLEAIYNDELTGQDGKVEFESDGWGVILSKSEKAIVPAKDGYDIQLTIDKTIQNFVEEAMTRVEKEYSPKKMLVIVANPKTGEILAVSQRPSFHPGTREGLTDNWLNEALETTIEPGSTLKMFTVAAAVEEKKWDSNAWYQSGQYKAPGATIRDVNRTGWGTITYLEGFQRSSNVSMAYLLERMGHGTFIDYIGRFGFGEKTGINLPNEASGKILDTRPIERITTAYGQGSTVTPIQMVQAASAIANNGVMMKPYVIDKIIDPNTGKVIQQEKPEAHGTPISAETAKMVRELLASTVTSEKGTARRFALNGYSVGGKTGTAEIPKPNGGGYLSGTGNYLYSFLGMAPADDPQLITYAIVQQPKLNYGQSGSESVSKLFNPIMESSLKYLNIVPDGEGAVDTAVIEDYTSKDSDDVMAKLQKDGFNPILIGEGGKIISQYPSGNTKLTVGSLILLKTDGMTTLPDFTGWSKKMIRSFKHLSGLELRLNGDGFVTSQSVSKGALLDFHEPVVIQLQVPSELYSPKEENTEAESIVGG
ncbi:penicillin-binding protein [Sporosarcina sp. HYO08]|uniref:penicillin-binding protein n=1 Tax=Sporosarcina sp. HYO08 TaxID=1759557 RepID=UPI0020A417A3|nr:penicillin-binding protein [Sporosarcina sp. HYO08]